MPTEIVTVEDLNEFRIRLLADMENLLKNYTQAPRKKWLKSFEVMTMLNITKNTLTTHRNNGVLYGKKVGGIYYYAYQEIMELLQKKAK
ncbi:helix-turn-helix domain-containing protein [Paradesertivirga mongoliensis]|nr:helix-turn-helix domain-containing protein [Pedobacter mongoliensis]